MDATQSMQNGRLVKTGQDVAIISRNVVTGFKNTGIFSFNRDTYSESDFVYAELCDRPVTSKAANEPITFDANAEENMISQGDQEVNERELRIRLFNSKILSLKQIICLLIFRHGLLPCLHRQTFIIHAFLHVSPYVNK